MARYWPLLPERAFFAAMGKFAGYIFGRWFIVRGGPLWQEKDWLSESGDEDGFLSETVGIVACPIFTIYSIRHIA